MTNRRLAKTSVRVAIARGDLKLVLGSKSNSQDELAERYAAASELNPSGFPFMPKTQESQSRHPKGEMIRGEYKKKVRKETIEKQQNERIPGTRERALLLKHHPNMRTKADANVTS